MPPAVFTQYRPLILASGSPRRHELLAELGLAHTVMIPHDAEPPHTTHDDPAEYVMRAAYAKAQAIADSLTPTREYEPVVLGADTVVVLPELEGPVILGKPASSQDALSMLHQLSGREHRVYTGCCLVWLSVGYPPKYECLYDAASVTFASWPDTILQAYVATGEPADKAGAYAIQGQGAFLVREIKGLWSTIVGLPVQPVLQHLRQGGALG